MSNWIQCKNGSLLNVANVLTLKVHKQTATVQAECTNNRTVDVEACATREEAQNRALEIAGLPTVEPEEPKKKPATPEKKPAKK